MRNLTTTFTREQKKPYTHTQLHKTWAHIFPFWWNISVHELFFPVSTRLDSTRLFCFKYSQFFLKIRSAADCFFLLSVVAPFAFWAWFLPNELIRGEHTEKNSTSKREKNNQTAARWIVMQKMCGVFAFVFDLVTSMPFCIAWENFRVYANVVCAPGCLPVAGIYSGK